MPIQAAARIRDLRFNLTTSKFNCTLYACIGAESSFPLPPSPDTCLTYADVSLMPSRDRLSTLPSFGSTTALKCGPPGSCWAHSAAARMRRHFVYWGVLRVSAGCSKARSFAVFSPRDLHTGYAPYSVQGWARGTWTDPAPDVTMWAERSRWLGIRLGGSLVKDACWRDGPSLGGTSHPLAVTDIRFGASEPISETRRETCIGM